MKKIIFLLLITIASYGQAVFDEGIQITNTESTTATKVNVQETDGSVNWINKSNLIDVLQFPNFSEFPSPGEVGKAYIWMGQSRVYYWNGIAYIEFTPKIHSSTHESGGADAIQGENVSVNVVPPTNNYTPTTNTLKGHLQGIDSKLGATTDALNTLDAKIPVNYSKIVYVNNTNPNSATIFDDVNPPVLNDNSLKANVSNLYVGTDASVWVYNTSTVNYVIKPVTSVTSNFYLSGTTTDAGSSKTASIYRTGTIGVGAANLGIAPLEVLGVNNNRIIYGRNSLSPTSGVTMEQGIALSGSKLEGEASLNDGYSLAGYNVNPASSLAMFSQVAQSADTGTFPLNLIQANRLNNSGTSASTVITRPILGISNYNNRLMTMQANGDSSFAGFITANSFLKSGATTTDALLAGGGVLSNPINGTATTGDVPVFSASRTLSGSTNISITNASYSMLSVKGSGSGNTGGGSIQFRNQNTLFGEIAGETESAGNGVIYFRSLTSETSTQKGSISSNGVWKIDNLAGIGTRHVVADASGNLSANSTPPDSRPYKVYTATLTQTGTDTPVATVLENTLGGTVVLSYSGVGSYVATLTGAFILGKTWCSITNSGSVNTTVNAARSSNDTVNISSLLSGTLANSVMSPSSLEIRVYNFVFLLLPYSMIKRRKRKIK